MAGIEEAFEKFVTRVSGRERSPAEQPLSKYKSYSEQELLENIEAKYPNQLQSFSQEDYQLNTMPMFEPKNVAPPRSYSPMPVEKYLREKEYMDLAEGGVASMFRERPGYQMGGITPQLNPFASREETLEEAIARGEIFYNPITGIEINPLTGVDVPGGRVLQSILDSQQQFMQQPQQSQTPQIQSPQLSYNEIQKANYARRMGELENKFANQGTSSTKYIQDMTNLLAQMKTSGGIDPLGAMQSKYYTGPSSGSVSEGRGIDANFVINRAQQSEREAAARVTPTRMAYGGRVSMSDGGLTTTVPPAKGPDSQGVESLFRRRYS
jgi:hypothetical protein